MKHGYILVGGPAHGKIMFGPVNGNVWREPESTCAMDPWALSKPLPNPSLRLPQVVDYTLRDTVVHDNIHFRKLQVMQPREHETITHLPSDLVDRIATP